MRYLFPFIITVGVAQLSASCSRSVESVRPTDSTFTLSLSVKGLDSGVFMLYYSVESEKKSDTIYLKNGKGILSGKMPSTVRAFLQRAYPPGYDMATFYLENGAIGISGALDSLDRAIVTGTASNELYQELKKSLEVVRREEAAFYKQMETLSGGKGIPQDSIFSLFNRIDKLRKKLTLDFVRSHPASIVSATEVQEMFMYNPDVAQFDSAVKLLDPSIMKTSTGKEIMKRLDIARRTDIGQPAPRFTMSDVNGKPVALTSLFGKYLLIDFWASWCGPCREDNPNLVRTYRDYNKKGFDIVSISLDDERDKDKWLDAIKEDQLSWLQLSDLKGWENAAARMYGINGIPMNFLLDKEGKIIAKGMRGSELRKKVESLIR